MCTIQLGLNEYRWISRAPVSLSNLVPSASCCLSVVLLFAVNLVALSATFGPMRQGSQCLSILYHFFWLSHTYRLSSSSFSFPPLPCHFSILIRSLERRCSKSTRPRSLGVRSYCFHSIHCKLLFHSFPLSVYGFLPLFAFSFTAAPPIFSVGTLICPTFLKMNRLFKCKTNIKKKNTTPTD